MSNKLTVVAVIVTLSILSLGCDEGANDWNSSAKISGYVYAGPAGGQGIPGVQVILESDPDSEIPYEGPDRWTETNGTGYFEGSVFLGNKADDNDSGYRYVGDMSVGYFWHGKSFRWTGGITVSPGSHFTLPPVDTTMFQ